MAADPTIFTCTLDTWVEVATGVMLGTVHKLSNDPTLYKQTYRLAASAAPTDELDAVPAFVNDEPLAISADAIIDVYIMAKGKEGSVRVDL
ncbi:MAG: hypothetical protein V3V24_09605 [Nitrospinaceae bacterium]